MHESFNRHVFSEENYIISFTKDPESEESLQLFSGEVGNKSKI